MVKISGEDGGVDTFDIEYFESVLPKRISDDKPLWEREDVPALNGGEVTYRIRMGDPQGVHIRLRSSINASTGLSDPTGQNSIRMWLADDHNRPLGHKIDEYTTRLPGWEKRMWSKFNKLRNLRREAGDCDVCGHPRYIWKVKKADSEFRGQRFAKCIRFPECKKRKPIWLMTDIE